MSIGNLIREARLAVGLTQAELGRQVGVSESMVCQLERGTKALTVPLGKQIAKALGVSPAALFGLEAVTLSPRMRG